MVDYSQWEEKHVQVTSLLLDAENPRIPPTPKPMEQRELIAELVQHDKVVELARDISSDGYSPIESLIGLRQDGKMVILEGNRRLAALKLLLSPDSAPANVVTKVRSYASDVDADSIKKVRVLFSPSREAAATVIMQKHTRNQIEKWEPVMQARFYRKLADAGLSTVELAKRYGGTPGEIAEFLRLEAAYELACRIDLPESVRAKVHDPRNFPVYVLKRLLEVPKARDALGVSFDEKGHISGKVSAEEFQKGFARVLTDIADEKINTRTINTAADTEKYLSTIKPDLPDKTKKGSFTAADFNKGGAASAPKPKTVPKKSTKPRESASVIPHGVKCNVKNTRIDEIFDELRQLKVEAYPNASAVMLRILLELSVGHYMDKTTRIQPLLQQLAKQGKKPDHYPPLKHLLTEMIKDTSLMPTLALKRINKLLSDPNSSFSLETLDSWVHNRFSQPTTRELRAYWDLFEGIFNVTLEEPPPPTKPGK